MARLGAGVGRGIGVGLRVSAGDLFARSLARTRIVARRHTGRAGAGLSIGVCGGHRALFYVSRLGALYTGGPGEYCWLAGVKHVLFGVSGGVGGVVLVFISGEF